MTPAKELTFYRENHTRRVNHEIVWLDPLFRDWLDHTYPDPDDILEQWSSVVSISPADGIAKSLTTGGRVLVYNLRKPFPDPSSGIPCFQIDVKGIGLTKSGFLQDSLHLADGRRRKELMWHRSREIYFGYENLAGQRRVVADLLAARRRGQAAPIPLAIIKLKQMVYEGRALSVKDLKKELGIEWEGKFALIIRGYPVTATRICDLTRWEEFTTPDFISVDDIETINWARHAFEKYELPAHLRAANGKFDRNPRRSYFNWFLQNAYHEVELMLTTGFSPSTSYETSTYNARHTHLQNHSTANIHVEWSPQGRIEDTSPDSAQRLYHILEIIAAEHDAVVNAGAYSLPRTDFDAIPSYAKFLQKILKKLGRSNYLTPLLHRQFSDYGGRGDNLLTWLRLISDRGLVSQ